MPRLMACRRPAATPASPTAPTAASTRSSSTPARPPPTSSSPPTAVPPGAPQRPSPPPTGRTLRWTQATRTSFTSPTPTSTSQPAASPATNPPTAASLGDRSSLSAIPSPRPATSNQAGCAAGVRNEVARSTDGGATWTITELTIVQGGACIGAQAGRGIFCINAGGSSFRSRSHPIMGVKPSDPTHVYMVYSGGDLEPNGTYSCGGGTGNHSDTLFRKSTDGGATWSAPVKINSDPVGANKDHYYPWMSVLPNGQIWVGWNDRRDDANDFLSKWYQAHSNDEGATWLDINGAPGNDVVADVQTQPSTFIGDYHGLGAGGNGVGNVLGMWFDSRISAAGDAFTDPQAPPPLGPTPTPTATATASPSPTATRTPTPTSTPSATACPGNQYTITPGTDTIVAGTTDTGSHCDDCITTVALPFSFQLYGNSYSSVNLSSNGTAQFVTSDSTFVTVCIPWASHDFTIHALFEDTRSDAALSGCSTYPGGSCGIYTSVSGTSPNRIFNIEWRTVLFGNNASRCKCRS